MTPQLFSPVALAVMDRHGARELRGSVRGITHGASPLYDVLTEEGLKPYQPLERLAVLGEPEVPAGHVWSHAGQGGAS